jgi:hypothetical protein
MYWAPASEQAPEKITVSVASRITMGALGLLIVVAGVCPQIVFALYR